MQRDCIAASYWREGSPWHTKYHQEYDTVTIHCIPNHWFSWLVIKKNQSRFTIALNDLKRFKTPFEFSKLLNHRGLVWELGQTQRHIQYICCVKMCIRPLTYSSNLFLSAIFHFCNGHHGTVSPCLLMLYHVKMYNDWWKLSIYSKLNDCSVSGRCWWHPPSLLQCCCRPAAGYWSVSRVLVVSAGRRAAVPPSLHHTTPAPATELSPPPRWQTGEQSEDLWKISNPTQLMSSSTVIVIRLR